MSQKAAPKPKKSWLRWLGFLGSIVLICVVFIYIFSNMLDTHTADSLALDAQGNVYVGDSSRNHIDKFNSQGDSLGTIGEKGDGPNQFKGYSSPEAISLDRQGNLYAVNDYSHVKKFDNQGKFIQDWQLSTSAGSTSAVDSKGNLYVELYGTPLVQKLDSKGQPINDWAIKAGATGPVQDVHGIALDSQDNVYLYDPRTKALSKYDPTGQFLQRWDNFGLDQQNSFVVDRQGNFYRTTTGHQIQKLNNQGQVVATWGKPSIKKEIDHKEYRAIQVDTQGNVYAIYLEDGPYSVDKYNPSGQLVKHWTVGWPSWMRPVIQFFLAPLLGIFLRYIFGIGVQTRSKEIDPLQESLPAWVQQTHTNPQTLRDHLNLKALQKQQQPKNSSELDGLALLGLMVGFVLFGILLINIVSLIFFGVTFTGIVWIIGSFTGMIWAGVWLVKREKKRTKKVNNEVETLLKQTLSNLPASDRATFVPKSNDLQTLLSVSLPMNLFFGIIFIVVYARTGESETILPMWLLQIGIVGAVIFLALLSATLINRRTQPERGLVKLNRAELVELYRTYGRVWLIFAGLTVVLDNLNELIVIVSNDASGASAFYVILTIFFAFVKYGYLLYGLDSASRRWIHARMDIDDYEGALRRAAWIRRFFNTTDERRFHAMLLIRAKRLREAEYVLHEGLVKLYPGSQAQSLTLAQLLSGLAFVRMDAGRYAEAMFFLEETIKLNPDSRINFSNLAEIYLRAGVRPDRALELLEWGNEKKGYWWLVSLDQRELLGERAINRAWAYAQLNRDPEAERFLNEALRRTNHKNQPSLASLYYRAACIRQIQGRSQDAAEYMRQAVQLDPAGLYGQWANEALHTLQPG